MANLKIPSRTLEDEFLLEDYQHDFNALNSELSTKMDKSDAYTKIEVNKIIEDDLKSKADKTNVYTKTEVTKLIKDVTADVEDIQDEISKLDSSLKDNANELENSKTSIELEIDVERKRINSFTSLAAGSTTGDAELIDGRIGANGLIYNNIGSAIREQFKDQKDIINFFGDRTLYLESIASALEGEVFSIESHKVENLLYIDGYEVTKNKLNISIKDNIVYVNGYADDFYYVKLTNGFELGKSGSGGDKRDKWTKESYPLPINQTYHLTEHKVSGSVEYLSPESKVAVSARNKDYVSLLSTNKGLVELTDNVAYIQLYLAPGTYTNYKVGIVLQKDVMSTKFTPYGYYNSSVRIVGDGNNNENNIPKDVPNNITANIYKEIKGTHFNAIQGACSDGKYIYYGIVNNKTDDDNTVGKIDISTKEIIKTTNELNLGHCNSMTYCSYDGCIHCVSLDEVSTIHRITTDLEYVDSYKVTIKDKYPQFTGFGAVDYNEKTEQFIFLIRGDKKGYAIFTKNMTFVKIIWCEYVESHVYGGVCSDNNFIYQGICGTNFEGVISIFNFNGDLIKTIQLENFWGEIEEPFIIKNKMYCSACRGDYTNHDIWELNLKNYEMV